MSMIIKDNKYNEKEQIPHLNITKIALSDKNIEKEKTSESTNNYSEENKTKGNSRPATEDETEWILKTPKMPYESLEKKK